MSLSYVVQSWKSISAASMDVRYRHYYELHFGRWRTQRFLDYISLDGHFVLLIFQANLDNDEFVRLYETIFKEFKKNTFVATIDDIELQA